jgi:hypothetical protein
VEKTRYFGWLRTYREKSEPRTPTKLACLSNFLSAYSLSKNTAPKLGAAKSIPPLVPVFLGKQELATSSKGATRFGEVGQKNCDR